MAVKYPVLRSRLRDEGRSVAQELYVASLLFLQSLPFNPCLSCPSYGSIAPFRTSACFVLCISASLSSLSYWGCVPSFLFCSEVLLFDPSENDFPLDFATHCCNFTIKVWGRKISSCISYSEYVVMNTQHLHGSWYVN